MKIFVTGGTGFIGSHFLRCPLAEGHTILALRRSLLPSCLPHSCEPQWIDCPLDSLDPAYLEGCDALVHFASPGVSPRRAELAELLYWNVTATLALAEKAKTAGVRRLVVAGSFAEYGRSADRFDPIPPNAPLEPTTAYATSKACSSVALSGFAIENKMELAYLRIFSAFGEGQFEANFWPSLRKAALAGEDFLMTQGEQVRDFVPVEDVAKVFWRTATALPIKDGYPFFANVGTGTPVRMRDFAEKWWTLFHAKGKLKVGALEYRPNEVMRFVPLVNEI